MKLKDVISKLADVQVDNDFAAQLEKMYSVALPDEVKRIVSLSKDTAPYEDFSLLRGLSHAEIKDASPDMSVDFISKGILPLFDVGENDYIVYDVREKAWYKFNIVDEIKFSKVQELSEYFCE
jgi:hypothetical protein